MAAKGPAAVRQSGAASQRTKFLDGNLCHEEGDLATVADDLRAQLLP